MKRAVQTVNTARALFVAKKAAAAAVIIEATLSWLTLRRAPPDNQAR